jgi:hypothetical protein
MEIAIMRTSLKKAIADEFILQSAAFYWWVALPE